MNLTLLSLLLLLLFAAAAAAAAPPVPPISCSDELVLFSTCLPYIAMSHNISTESPSPKCCDDVATSFNRGGAVCFCYFVQRPNIFGYPLNSTKLMSLTSICPVKEENSNASFSLQTLCSGLTALPPLHGITGGHHPPLPNASARPPPNVSGPPPPAIGSSQDPIDTSVVPEPTDKSPTQSSSPITPATTSSPPQMIGKFSWYFFLFFPGMFTFVWLVILDSAPICLYTV